MANELTHSPQDKMADLEKNSYTVSWEKMFVFLSKNHWSFIQRVHFTVSTGRCNGLAPNLTITLANVDRDLCRSFVSFGHNEYTGEKRMFSLNENNFNNQGPDSIQSCRLISIGNPTVEIRRSSDRLISTVGFPILVRWHLYIESPPCLISMA